MRRHVHESGGRLGILNSETAFAREVYCEAPGVRVEAIRVECIVLNELAARLVVHKDLEPSIARSNRIQVLN
jgi:hypothetical protein